MKMEEVSDMFSDRNYELTPYKLEKEYTWEYKELDDDGEEVKRQRKFKVIKKFKFEGEEWCKVEYTSGDCAGDVVDIPLEDMPPTLEKR